MPPTPPPGGYPPQGPPAGGYPPQGPPGGYPPQGPPGGYPPGGGYGGPPTGPSGFGPQPPKKGLSNGQRWGILGGAAALVILLVVGILVFTGDDEASAGEIFLDPAGETGNDPFTSTVAVSGQDEGLTDDRGGTQSTAQGSIEVVSQNGSQVGLYGGTEDQSSCNRQQLIDFLTDSDNRAKAEAWADVQGIDVASIPDFINSLTPLRLRFDTRVTNHGFRDGRANPIQSVLEAGTAVLVDARGVPRVRCACGNPLLEPQATSATPTFTGTRWPGFSTTTIQRITVVNNITNFNVTNIVNNQSTTVIFVRPAGTDGGDDTPGTGGPPDTTPPDTSPPDTSATTEPPLGTGDVQVTLRWSGTADLDLHVTDPAGAEINFSTPTSPSGGQLDVDCIPGTSCASDGNHVENVFWPTGGAPSGDYSAFVHNFSGAATPYTLTVLVGGQQVADDSDTVAAGADSSPVAFSVS